MRRAATRSTGKRWSTQAPPGGWGMLEASFQSHLHDGVGHHSCRGEVAPEMDARPDRRFRDLVRDGHERGGLAGEEVAEDHGRCRVKGCSVRRVRRKWWGREDRRERRVELEWPDPPVVELRV